MTPGRRFCSSTACSGLGVQRVHILVERADVNYPVRHGRRGFHKTACGVAPLQDEVPNVVDAKHLLTRVPALHVVLVKLAPSVVALARWLLAPRHRHEARIYKIKTTPLIRFMTKPPEEKLVLRGTEKWLHIVLSPSASLSIVQRVEVLRS